MAAPQVGLKQFKISRNQRTSMIAVGLAMAVLIFTMFLNWRLYKVKIHQDKVISDLSAAQDVLKASSENIDKLEKSFEDFNRDDSLIKGQKVRNSVLISRAFPNEYDNLEMTNTWEKFLVDRGFDGTPPTFADSLEEGEGCRPVGFQLSVNLSDRAELSRLLKDLDNTIQPVNIRSIDISGYDLDSGNMTVNLMAEVYIQPTKSPVFKKETVSENQKATPSAEQTEGDEEQTEGDEGQPAPAPTGGCGV